MSDTTATGLEDTIAALATARGRGAIALVRISGGKAREILYRLCPASGNQLPAARRVSLLGIHHPRTGELLDRALVTVFSAPESYTGEDVVEISTHGGLLTPQLVLDATHAAGARPALPGEFTRRALLNGKVDLLQAEAIADLIDGRSPAMHRAAVHQMERGLSRRIEELRSAVLAIEALVAYEIDFPEEDEPPVGPERIQGAAQEVRDRLLQLLHTVPQGEMLREGALVVLAGRPNSGKSSLFNALLGRERSIVTEVPGTTRDAVEADATLGGFPFRLVDTAGLRETEDRVESLGIEVARRYLEAADLLLFCSEASAPIDGDEERFLDRVGRERTILVRTKGDLARDRKLAARSVVPGGSGRDGGIEVSVVSGEGLDRLEQGIIERAFGEIRSADDEAPIVTSERHRRALQTALDEIEGFQAAAESGVPPPLAAVHLRSAVAALEELIGTVTMEDVLGTLFSRFCVGK